MVELSDADLLARSHGGDGEALERLLARHELPLFHFLVGVLGDHHLAEDALQETFVRALERLDGVDPEHLRGWLFTVAYHQAMLLKRRLAGGLRHVRPSAEQPQQADPLPGPAESAERAEEARRLRALLEQLPPAQREVIRQRVYEGK